MVLGFFSLHPEKVIAETRSEDSLPSLSYPPPPYPNSPNKTLTTVTCFQTATLLFFPLKTLDVLLENPLPLMRSDPLSNGVLAPNSPCSPRPLVSSGKSLPWRTPHTAAFQCVAWKRSIFSCVSEHLVELLFRHYGALTQKLYMYTERIHERMLLTRAANIQVRKKTGHLRPFTSLY